MSEQQQVRVSSRGAITVPKDLREAIGLGPGDVVTCHVDPWGRLVLTPLTSTAGAPVTDAAAAEAAAAEVPAAGAPTADAPAAEVPAAAPRVFDGAGDGFDPSRHLRDTARLAESVWSNAS